MKHEQDWRQPPIDYVASGNRHLLGEVRIAETSIMSDNGLFEYGHLLRCPLAPESGLILDIGTGRNARFLNEARKKGIAAVGIAPFLTPDGRPHIPIDMPDNKRPRLAQGIASALPFADEQFDACVSLHAISYICPFVDEPTQSLIYSELMRVLRPGGYAYIGQFTPEELAVAIPQIEQCRRSGAEIYSYKSRKFVDRRLRRNVYVDRYTVHLRKPGVDTG